MKYPRLLALLACAFFAAQNPAAAQGFPGSGGGGFGSVGQSRGGGSSTGLVTRDTSDIYYFFAENPAEVFPFSDSLLGNFQMYDPLRQGEFDLANLGNFGSAHRPLFWQPTWRRGFDVGLHQFDAYQLRTEDVRFYKIQQATTQAGFSQQNQANTQTFVRFSRNFANGLNLSLEHRRINMAGNFDHQQALNSDVAVGMWYRSKYGNYDGFFSFVTNSVQQEDNGGIVEGDAGVFTDPFRLDVNLQTANTRYANKEYAYTQYFYLDKIFSEASIGRRQKTKDERRKRREQQQLERERYRQERDSLAQLDTSVVVLPDSLRDTPPVDSTFQPELPPSEQGSLPDPPKVDGPLSTAPAKRAPGDTPIPGQAPYPGAQPVPGQAPYPGGQPSSVNQRVFTLYHQIAWRTEDYKFYATAADSLFFGTFWQDDRGLRHFVETRRLQNTFKLQTFKVRQAADAGTRQRDLLEVGLVHSANFVDQEPRDTGTLHNLFLTGKFNFSPNDRLRVNTYGHLGLGANAGDFRLSGELFLSLKKIGSLHLEAVNQLYSPTLVQHQFFATERQLWKNDFSKTLETSLMGTYSLPSLHASASAQYHLLSDLIYFDTDGLPRQQGGVTSVFQLIFRKDFHFGSVHSENWLGLQESTSDVLRLPSLYSKHSLYLEGFIFKDRMLTRLGVDARLATAYTPTAYQPLTGQFYLQNEQALPFTPLVDVFLNFKVKTFRFFFKIENVLSFPLGEFYFQTAGQPLPYGFANGGLRMGINWRLVD